MKRLIQNPPHIVLQRHTTTERDFHKFLACKQQEGLKEGSNGSDLLLTFQSLLGFYFVLQRGWTNRDLIQDCKPCVFPLRLAGTSVSLFFYFSLQLHMSSKTQDFRKLHLYVWDQMHLAHFWNHHPQLGQFQVHWWSEDWHFRLQGKSLNKDASLSHKKIDILKNHTIILTYCNIKTQNLLCILGKVNLLINFFPISYLCLLLALSRG